MTNRKTKILMDLQRIYTQKNLSISLQAKKLNMAPESKMDAKICLRHSVSTEFHLFQNAFLRSFYFAITKLL
jgi:hypothetical protein